MRAALAFSCCLTGINAARAEQVEAVPQIVDADSGYAGATKIRLCGIEAPEMDQVGIDASGKDWKCGIEARKKLQAYTLGTDWVGVHAGMDRYKRHLATGPVDGVDV